MKRTGIIFAVCFALAAAGCSLDARVSFQDRPEISAIRAGMTKPVDLKVAVALPVLDEPEATDEKAADVFHPRTDGSAFQKDIVEALRSVGAFQEVVGIGGGYPPDSLEANLTAAREARADLLIVPKITKNDINFIGFSGWRIPNLVVWFYLWLPSFWIRDEKFGARMEAGFDVYSVHSGWKLGEYEAAGEARETLNDLERGWIFAGILRVPGALEEENWQLVESVLGPRALDELRSDFVQKLNDGFLPSVGTKEFNEKTRKALALVVGVEDYKDYRLARWIRHCNRDAERFGTYLKSSRGWNLPPYNLLLLRDGDASAKGIREALQEISERAEFQDTVLLYFAGLSYACRPGVAKSESTGAEKKNGEQDSGKDGATEKQGGTEENGESTSRAPEKDKAPREAEIVAAFLPFDATFDGPFATGISVEELAKWTEKIKAGNLIVILDTAFDSDGEGRSLTRVKNPGEPLTLAGGFPWERFPRRDGLTLMISTNPGQAAMSIPPEKSGMFTWYLLDVATDDRFAADRNEDGAITLSELFECTQKDMKSYLSLNTAVQTPVMCGKPYGTVFFAGKGAGTYSPPAPGEAAKEGDAESKKKEPGKPSTPEDSAEGKGGSKKK